MARHRRAILAREEAAPQAAQRHRHHRHRGALDDAAHAVLERIHLAGGRDLALGEDADHLALGQRGGDGVVGALEQRLVFVRRRNGDRLDRAEEPGQQRHAEDSVVHHEAHRPAHEGPHHHRVDKADMVADQQARALVGNPLVALHLHAVDGMDQQPHHEADQEFRQQRVDVDRHHGVEDARHQEQLRDGEAGAREHHRQHRRSDHEQRVEDVVGGDDARAVRRLAAALDQRVQRHAVEAAEHRQQKQIGQHAPVAMVLQEAGHARQRIVRDQRLGMRGEVQVHREHRHADRAERHQADLHHAARELFAQHRAQADADREHRQQQRHHVLIAAEHVASKGEE